KPASRSMDIGSCIPSVGPAAHDEVSRSGDRFETFGYAHKPHTLVERHVTRRKSFEKRVCVRRISFGQGRSQQLRADTWALCGRMDADNREVPRSRGDQALTFAGHELDDATVVVPPSRAKQSAEVTRLGGVFGRLDLGAARQNPGGSAERRAFK